MMNEQQPSKLRSLWPLAMAGTFMLVGILILIYLGRDTARLMNAPLDELDLKVLLSDESVPTIESLQGKVIVLHFWGTWSKPSQNEFSKFVDVYRQYKRHSDVRILSISCSPGMENDLDKLKDETSDFLSSFNVEMPTYADPAMFTRGKLARMLASGGFVYPFTLVTDKEGIVREFWLGENPNAMKELKVVIDRLSNSTSK
jgi:cytochrome c biogenesis protein CcmG, thiol:disulfide interchange protein DsbE